MAGSKDCFKYYGTRFLTIYSTTLHPFGLFRQQAEQVNRIKVQNPVTIAYTKKGSSYVQ